MIAADTSTWIAYLQGLSGEDTGALAGALAAKQAQMVPAVFCELVSSPALSEITAAFLEAIPMLGLKPGYWKRAGQLRAKLAVKGRKARLGDALITQCCLDHDLALLTRDHDFAGFTEVSPLRLFPPARRGNGSRH